MVRFGYLSVTLSNACEILKVCRQHYTVSMAMPMDFALRGCFRPIGDY